ncbi:MAG: MmcQ/YjbR family DNA-binding protein [Saprospiraceae bacterium]
MNEIFRKTALSFPGTEENAHFERRAFKITGRRIFATLQEDQQSANIKLSLPDQATFSEYDKRAVFPLPNKWGLQGWTTFDLTMLTDEIVAEALYAAYIEMMGKKDISALVDI